MAITNATSKSINLTDFRNERTSLLSAAEAKINAGHVNRINHKIHNHYEISNTLIKDRLDGITGKFRKLEKIYYLYFEGMDHDLLTATSVDLPLSRECTFIDAGATLKQYFEVDDRLAYQELIDYHFQEFILFSASILENLVYLSETLIRKVSIHLSGNKPASIVLPNFKILLDFLHELNYRNPVDPVPQWLNRNDAFIKRYFPTINELRNRYIHGFSRKLGPHGTEYIITEPLGELTQNSPDVNIEVFAEKILSNLRVMIPDFFNAVRDTIIPATQLPA